MKKFSKSFGSLILLSFCDHIIARVQAIQETHNQFIVRVLTADPHVVYVHGHFGLHV